MDAFRQGHLPRLAREHYCGLAFVYWTVNAESRATGWLTPQFHALWRWVLLHASARHELICAVYMLMPDHLHLLWLGTNERESDQRTAIAFLTKHTRPHLGSLSWQRQPYDHVLSEQEKQQDAFMTIAS